MTLIRPIIEFLSVLLFFILLTVWFTWPLSSYITEAFIANQHNSDAVQYIWNAWVFKSQLTEGINPFYTTKILFPEGVNLWMHTYTPIMSMFALPFKNTMLGVNLFMLLQYALSGTGAYYLCKKLTAHWLPGILTGILFAFSSYKLTHAAEHYNLLLTATIPFFILSFLQTFNFKEGKLFPTIKNYYYLTLTIFIGILTGFSDYYCTFFLIYFCIFWSLWYFIIPYWRTSSLKKKWGTVIILFVICHIITEQLVNWGIDDRGGIWWGGDLILFFIPNQTNLIYNTPLIEHLRESFIRLPGSLEFQLFLSYTAIGLLFFVLLRVLKNKMPSHSGPWLFALIIFIMICFPRLQIAGVNIIYLPNALLHFTPFFNNIRCPTRIQVFISLFIPLCGTWFLYASNSTSFAARYKHIICISLILYAIIELTPGTLPLLQKKDIPSIMADVKQIKNNTVLTIPLGVSDGMKQDGLTDVNNLFYQTTHEKNLIGGYISRVPDKTFERVENDSIVKQLFAVSISKTASFSAVTEEQKNTFLKTYNIGGVLIHPDYTTSTAHAYIRVLLSTVNYTVVKKDGWLLYIIK